MLSVELKGAPRQKPPLKTGRPKTLQQGRLRLSHLKLVHSTQTATRQGGPRCLVPDKRMKRDEGRVGGRGPRPKGHVAVLPELAQN